VRAARGQLSLSIAAGQRVRYLVPGALAALALAAIVVVADPASALWVLAGAGALVLAVLRPRTLCYVLIPAVPLGTLAPVRVGPLHAGPTDLLVGALAVGWLVRTWPRLRRGSPAQGVRPAIAGTLAWWRRDRPAAAMTAALVAYLLVLVLSAAVASSRSMALKEILKWGEVLVVFAIAASLLRKPAHFAIAVWTMIAAGVGEALHGYVQWVVTSGDLGVNGSGVRVFGTFDQPNPYAAYLNLSLPIALAFALFGRPTRTRWIAAGAAALMLGAHLLANSRGGLLALSAAVVVIVVVGLGVERLALALGIAVALVGGLALARGTLPHRIQDRLSQIVRSSGVAVNGPVTDANFSTVDRLAHWVAGIRMFLAHPILGVGAGNYDAAYSRYAEPSFHLSLSQAHNYYINAAAETGTVGLISFVVLLGAMFVVSWRAAHAGTPRSPSQPDAASDSEARRMHTWLDRARIALAQVQPRSSRSAGTGGFALGLGILGVITAVAVHSFVDDVFVHAIELQLALCLAMAVAIACSARARGAAREIA
jgi:O-antigen ligase